MFSTWFAKGIGVRRQVEVDTKSGHKTDQPSHTKIQCTSASRSTESELTSI